MLGRAGGREPVWGRPVRGLLTLPAARQHGNRPPNNIDPRTAPDLTPNEIAMPFTSGSAASASLASGLAARRKQCHHSVRTSGPLGILANRQSARCSSKLSKKLPRRLPREEGCEHCQLQCLWLGAQHLLWFFGGRGRRGGQRLGPNLVEGSLRLGQAGVLRMSRSRGRCVDRRL